MKKEVLILIISLLILIPFVNSDNFIEGDNYVPGEMIVKYKEGFSGNGNEIIGDNEIIVYEYLEKPLDNQKLSSDNLQVLSFENNNLMDIIEDYNKLPEIAYAEPNYILKMDVIPDDSNYSLKYGLKNINLEKAWNISTGNSSIVISIIDTGVDWNHPDLSANIWNNTDENCDSSVDADGNGYNGDCRGYDFVNVSSGCSSNDDCSDEDNDPMDYNSHGTHTAGIAAAVSNNSNGTTGACWNCQIMPVRAGYEDTSGKGSLAVADIIQALRYSTDNNATIISMSFGGAHSISMQEAINYSYDNGTILVASAGNDGLNSKQYPCGYDNVICISALDSDNTSASYSNYGDWIKLAAPGTSIFSTYFDDRYVSQSGTSMATPMVAGSIGILKQLFPSKNQTEIRDSLNDTGNLVDFNSTVNISMINVYASILDLDNKNPNVTLINPSDNQINLTQNQTFSCNASDWQLKNITLEIWNASDLYYNDSKDITGIVNETSFNVSNINYGTYKWNCKSYDNKTNYAYATNNFTLYIGNITTSLVSPLNNTNKKTNKTFFNCSSRTETLKELSNLTFSLWNSSSVLIYNDTQTISDNYDSYNFSYNFSVEDSYKWNCEGYNNHTEKAIGDSNFTFVYDITQPVVELISPANTQSYTANSQEITFEFNISEANEVNNCSLIVDGNLNSTNTSIIKNLTQNFVVNFGTGTYNWNVNCTDKANNIGNSSQRSFTITAPVSTSSGGGGGGGGGGAAISSAKTFVISKEQGSGGYNKKLSERDKIRFTFFDQNKGVHTLTLDDVGLNYVYLTITSNPISLKLGIGQSAKLNLTNSEYYDLFVKLNSIENNKADITLQLINEEIPKVPGEEKEVIKETGEEKETTGLDFELIRLKTIVIILAIILGIIILKNYLKKKNYKKTIRNYKTIFNKPSKSKRNKSKSKKK